MKNPIPMNEMPPVNEVLERQRRLRRKNIAVMMVLVGLVALFFLITILRMGGS